MPTYVGLDCGGSSSRVVAMDHTGAILFQGQSGGANLASTPERIIGANLRKAALGCPQSDFVCGCFAGLLTQEDRDRALIHLSHAFPGAVVKAEPDYAAALYATAMKPDVCVIAGTGSLVCSSIQGKICKSGGGGFVLGDFGSAFQIGKEALQHYLFGLESPTPALKEGVCQLFGSLEPNPIVAKFYKITSPAAHLAKLAKVVSHDANAGSQYAIEIIDSNMSKLADIVKRHMLEYNLGQSPFDQREKVSMPSFSILLAGGVWKAGHTFRDAFYSHIQERFNCDSIHTQVIDQPPVRGALRLAKELSHSH